MPLTNLRTNEAVKTSKGSPILIYAKVATTSPYALATPVTWYQAPLLTNSNRAGDTADENLEIEDGVNEKLVSADTFTLNTTFAQQDLLTKKFIEFDSKDETFCFIKEEHAVPVKDATGASQYQYAIYPAVKRTGSMTRNAKSAETEVSWAIQNITALKTITDIPNAAASGFRATLPSTVAVAAERAYDLIGVNS